MKIVVEIKVNQPCLVKDWVGFGIIQGIYQESMVEVALYRVPPDTTDGAWAEFAKYKKIPIADIRFDEETVERLALLTTSRLTTDQILEPDRCMTVAAITALPALPQKPDIDPRLINLKVQIIATGTVTKVKEAKG